MTTLDVKKVARELEVTPQTVKKYVRAGILPMIKLNGTTSPYKISEQRFQRWFDEEWDEEIIVNNIL